MLHHVWSAYVGDWCTIKKISGSVVLLTNFDRFTITIGGIIVKCHYEDFSELDALSNTGSNSTMDFLADAEQKK